MARFVPSLSFPTQVTASVLGIVGVGLLGAALLAAAAVERVDALSGAREARLVRAALERRFEALPVEQQSATLGSEAVLRVRADQQAWIEGNLGVWMQEYFGHDLNFVLTPADAPLYAAADGKTVGAATYAGIAPGIRSLVAEARARLAAGEEAPEDISVVDYVHLNDAPALASVVPIVPSDERVRQTPGDERLHIAVDYLDAAFVEAAVRDLELQEARFAPPGRSRNGELSVPLHSSKGVEIARLVWAPAAPGRRLIESLIPAMVLLLLVGSGLIIVLLRRLLRASSQLQASEARNRFLAFHDPLTRLANRALFEDRLSQALGATGRGGPDVTLLLLDLDRFKHVNDRLGHPAGDELIRQVGSRLLKLLRRSDTVARLGGDEFTILLLGTMESGALHSICLKIIEELSSPYDLEGNIVHISASVGAVRASMTSGDAQEMMRKADIALYQAKESGRSRFRVFAEEMDELVRRRDRIERDLRSALETGLELKLEYQPVFDRNGELIGAEALSRWDHLAHGELSPEVYLHVAEERGLIQVLGLQVLAQACRFAAESDLAKVSVNVSPAQLDGNFSQNVLATLAAAGLPAARLELEFPERAILDAAEPVYAQLRMLASVGVSITLDNFTTWGSIFQHLRDVGVSALKIGRNVVTGIGVDPDSESQARALVGVASAMGLKVAAQGIETLSQRDKLMDMGCQTLQGFLLGRPMAPGQLALLCRARKTAATVELAALAEA